MFQLYDFQTYLKRKLALLNSATLSKYITQPFTVFKEEMPRTLCVTRKSPNSLFCVLVKGQLLLKGHDK